MDFGWVACLFRCFFAIKVLLWPLRLPGERLVVMCKVLHFYSTVQDPKRTGRIWKRILVSETPTVVFWLCLLPGRDWGPSGLSLANVKVLIQRRKIGPKSDAKIPSRKTSNKGKI